MTSGAGPGTTALKWQALDSGLLQGKDRLNFLLDLRQGRVREFQEKSICNDKGIKTSLGGASWTRVDYLGDSLERCGDPLQRKAPAAIKKKKPPPPPEKIWPGLNDPPRKDADLGPGFFRFAPDAPRPGGPGAPQPPPPKSQPRWRQRQRVSLRRSASLPVLAEALTPAESEHSQSYTTTCRTSVGSQPMAATTSGRVSFREIAEVEPQFSEADPSETHLSEAGASPPSERGVEVMCAPMVMKLYDGLKDWRPKWEPQPLSKHRYERIRTPPLPTTNREKRRIKSQPAEMASMMQAVDDETLAERKLGKLRPSAYRLPHQGGRVTGFDFAGCICHPTKYQSSSMS